jgi:hypothetical protein
MWKPSTGNSRNIWHGEKLIFHRTVNFDIFSTWLIITEKESVPALAGTICYNAGTLDPFLPSDLGTCAAVPVPFSFFYFYAIGTTVQIPYLTVILPLCYFVNANYTYILHKVALNRTIVHYRMYPALHLKELSYGGIRYRTNLVTQQYFYFVLQKLANCQI